MRTFDATAHNVMANHPETIKALGWDPANGWMVFDELAKEPAYYALLHNGAHDFTVEEVANGILPEGFPTFGFICEWSAPGVWQIHTVSLPEARGNLVGEAKKLIHEMFTEHGADMIWGMCAMENIRARKFFPKIGADNAGEGVHHVTGDVEYFRNSKARWLRDHWNNDK